MSFEKYTQTVCDKCNSAQVDNIPHYEIRIRQFSAINGKYFKPKFIHICWAHFKSNSDIEEGIKKYFNI